MSAQYITKTHSLPQFSLKCDPIQPDIHKDPSIGAQTYDILMAGDVVAGIVKLVILGCGPAII